MDRFTAYSTLVVALLASEFFACPCCCEPAAELKGYCGTCGRCIETCEVCGDALADYGCPSCTELSPPEEEQGLGIDDDDPVNYARVPLERVPSEQQELDREIYGDDLPF